jgi:hypothetical protein
MASPPPDRAWPRLQVGRAALGGLAWLAVLILSACASATTDDDSAPRAGDGPSGLPAPVPGAPSGLPAPVPGAPSGLPAPVPGAPSGLPAPGSSAPPAACLDAQARVAAGGLEGQAAGRGLVSGRRVASQAAAAHVTAQTDDAYLLRAVVATGFGGLAFVVLGALAAAAVVARLRRTPTPREAGRPVLDHLARRLQETLTGLRGTPSATSVLGVLARHFEDLLGRVEARGKQLGERARALTTAPHPVSGPIGPVALEAELLSRLEDLLAMAERLQVELLAWCERAEADTRLRELIERRIEALHVTLEGLDADTTDPREGDTP